MAKATVTRAPVVSPIEKVTLELTEDEAHFLLALTGAVCAGDAENCNAREVYRNLYREMGVMRAKFMVTTPSGVIRVKSRD